MKSKKVNAEHVWKQLEDQVAPRLRLSLIERVVYYHLLRHSRLEGKLRLRFSIAWLARGTFLSSGPVRQAVRRLASHGALRLVERSKKGHVVEVRVPAEIPAAHRVAACGTSMDRQARLNPAWIHPDGIAPGLRAAAADPASPLDGPDRAPDPEETDFMKNNALRQAIHLRERGLCFYCLRRLTTTVRCLDHVVPRAQSGHNSYRNLVSCCLECNSRKGEKPAGDFLRYLYRERRLTAIELTGRQRALDALAAGKLRPTVQDKQIGSKEVAM